MKAGNKVECGRVQLFIKASTDVVLLVALLT